MSTEQRLERLGLLHLIDKPEELKAALEKQRLEIEAKKARYRSNSEREAPPKKKPDYVLHISDDLKDWLRSLPPGGTFTYRLPDGTQFGPEKFMGKGDDASEAGEEG